MEKLWGLKFWPLVGNPFVVYFDSGEAARAVFDGHARLLSKKPSTKMKPLIFNDLIGSHCLRADFFPYSAMFEIGPCDLIFTEINKKIQESQQAARSNQEMGFK